jgi:large subunit ribosomal protein L18
MDAKNNMATARLLGLAAAKCAKAAGIKEVVVDRGGHRFHGRVKAICEAAAESGLLPGVKLGGAAEADVQKEELK